MKEEMGGYMKEEMGEGVREGGNGGKEVHEGGD